MRAAVLATVVAVAQVPAAYAASSVFSSLEPRVVRLSIPDQPRFAHREHDADLPLLGREMPQPASAEFSIGPFHAEGMSEEAGRGRRARLAPHYRLDGVSVLGGSVGGSLDGRGGMLTLDWHTGR
jgi:hypothetical protein